MAFFRSPSLWKFVAKESSGRYRAFATATSPKFGPSTVGAGARAGQQHNKYAITGEYAPIYIVGGMVVVAVAMAAHTAKQQLMHSPPVSVNKRRREMMAEVDDPDRAAASGDKFLSKSWIRKIAHIQDPKPSLQDAVKTDPYTRSRKSESLKTVGVNPKSRSGN
ncbi:hypothetical protein ACFE04_024517 [Oxalis oulophora]